jgi:hypothetical protein
MSAKAYEVRLEGADPGGRACFQNLVGSLRQFDQVVHLATHSLGGSQAV